MQANTNVTNQTFWQRLHLDAPLLGSLILLTFCSLFILYSASNQNVHVVAKQMVRFALAYSVLFTCAQIPPHKYFKWAPWIFTTGVFLLIVVLIAGHIGKGARRWLDVGLINIQPSEILKIAMPMMLAWYLHDKVLPPTKSILFTCSLLLLLPVLLTAKEPDLGTAIVIAAAGCCVLLLAGISWWWIVGGLILIAASGPILWHFLHAYQRERILTFLSPERDPLGTGYHIIQSKIAIGSGGVFGKGWLNGTQSHLQFLPEHATDFIFAVVGEEFGFLGSLTLLALMLVISGRALYISTQAQSTFFRLLAGSLSLTFFISFFVNVGMVIGVLPVVGLPLPLISYGGTSMVTIMAGFGIIMSIHTHRTLLGS